MSIYKNLVNATLMIECGESRGSGFHFIKPEIIVSNYHVVEDHISGSEDVLASTQDGDEYNLELVDYSDEDNYDYAVFKTKSPIDSGRFALNPPNPNRYFQTGLEVAFSGFPHGILDLLVQQAIISGEVDDKSYYLDGSVNGGNSGGPIVDRSDGVLLGIVTERRYLGHSDLEDLEKASNQLQKHWSIAKTQGSVFLQGINFGEFSAGMADAMVLIKKVIDANANSGIGIGYSIQFVHEACMKKGIV